MTEYEITDLGVVTMSNLLTAFSILLSIITAYVIAAFFAGDRLTTTQAWIVNVCFLVAAGVMGLISLLIFTRLMERIDRLREIVDGQLRGAVVDFTWVLAGLFVVLISGCMLFMWNVRHPRPV